MVLNLVDVLGAFLFDLKNPHCATAEFVNVMLWVFSACFDPGLFGFFGSVSQ